MATVDTTGFVSEIAWGVFNLDGSPTFDVDTCVSVAHDANTKVSSFPVEDGGFASYNKVTAPFICPVLLGVGGSEIRMKAFLEDLDAALNSIDKYNVVTPERTYLNATLEKSKVVRDQRHAGLVMAELTFIEIREVTPLYATVALPAKKLKNPNGASKVTTGKQQTQASGPAEAPLSYDNVVDRARKAAGIGVD